MQVGCIRPKSLILILISGELYMCHGKPRAIDQRPHMFWLCFGMFKISIWESYAFAAYALPNLEFYHTYARTLYLKVA
jgi:hypothetical protein